MKINKIEVKRNDKFILTFPKNIPLEVRSKCTRELNDLLHAEDKYNLARMIDLNNTTMTMSDDIGLIILRESSEL
ncbi:hypothetical protein AAXE64_07695 [Priestia megaterium]